MKTQQGDKNTVIFFSVKANSILSIRKGQLIGQFSLTLVGKGINKVSN